MRQSGTCDRKRSTGMAQDPSESKPQSGWSRFRWGAVVLLAAVAAAVVSALLVSILERKQEARNPFFRVVALDDTIEDPSVWGRNFPSQYDSYRRTVDQ